MLTAAVRILLRMQDCRHRTGRMFAEVPQSQLPESMSEAPGNTGLRWSGTFVLEMRCDILQVRMIRGSTAFGGIPHERR